jgi:hypothetical protein
VTLTAHGIVGGAIVSLLTGHPVLGTCLAFASHFLLDAIPHMDYGVRSASINPKIGAKMRYDRALLIDAITLGIDAALGVSLALVLFATRDTLILVACGACAALLPDALQFAYMRYPHEPLVSLQRFHVWAHCTKKITEPVRGIVSQLGFIAAVVVVTWIVAPLM